MSEEVREKTTGEKGKEQGALGWQEELFKSWQEAWRKGFENWQKLWEQGAGKFPGTEIFSNWIDFVSQQFQKLSEGAGWGLGAEVFSKMLNASAIYTQVLEFWKNAVVPVALSEGKFDAEKIKALSDRWLEQYQKVMETLWGAEPETSRAEIAQAYAQMLKSWNDFLWGFISPLIGDINELPERIQRALKGDAKGAIELYGLFRKSYEHTIGKILQMPAMGYFRELQERINKSIDSYVEYLTVLQEYYSLFYQTGIRAMERVLSRLEEFKDEDWSTPEGVRKFYRLWWTINEDTYHELFLSEEFINLLREVLIRGLLFKKWLDELYDKMVEPLPIPRKKDMDEVYRAIYELKKEVRWQRKALEKLTGKDQIPEEEQ